MGKALIVCENDSNVEKCLSALYTPATLVVGGEGLIDALVANSTSKPIVEAGFPKQVDKAHILEIDGELDPLALSEYVRELAQKESYDVILFGDSRLSLWIAGRVAGLLKASVITDVVGIDKEEDGVIITRPAYEETLWLRYKVIRTPLILSIRKGSFSPWKEKGSPKTVVREKLSRNNSLKVIESLETGGEKDLSTADIVIGVGLGLKSKEDLSMIKKLADLLDAAWGVTRPLIDEGWVPKERQIGHSGVRIAPKLYIAIGLSGASYHVSGVKGSGTIIAINKDPQAPIFKYADYGIIGDLYDVVPKLIGILEKELSRRE